MRRRSKPTAWMLTLMLVAQLLMPQGMAVAADVPVDITDVKMYYLDGDMQIEGDVEDPAAQRRLSLGEDVQLDYKWKFQDGRTYEGGDTSTFTLPNIFKLHSDIVNEPLTSSQGQIGTFSISRDTNIVVMSFNDAINGLSGVTGTLSVWSTIDENYSSDDTTVPISFPTEGGPKIITVQIRPEGGSLIQKSGTPNRAYNGTSIDWTVDVNTVEDEISGAVLTDPILDGQELDVSSIRVQRLKVALDGTVQANGFADPGEFDASGSTSDRLLVNFGGEIDSAYRVTFTTNITAEWDGNRTFDNTATFTGVDVNRSAPASVNIRRGEPLNKFERGYNAATQTVKWEIQYNYNGKTIENAELTDTISGFAMGLVTDSVKVSRVTLNDSGNEAGSVNFTNYTLTETTNGGFTLLFNETVTTPMKIEYETRAVERVFGTETVTNQIHDGRSSESANRRIDQVILSKSRGTVDYAAETVDWTISINRDSYPMNDVRLTDEFTNKGLRLLPETMRINGATVTHSVYTDSYIANTVTGAVYLNPLTPGTWENGFTLQFDQQITGAVTVAYTTAFDIDQTDVRSTGFANRATLDWAQRPSDRTVRAQDTFVPNDYTLNNGFKTGEYNAAQKKFTWEIGINYNRRDNINADLADTLVQGQQLVGGSIRVYEMTVPTNGEPVRGAPASAGLFHIEESSGDFRLTSGPISDPYWIVFETTVEGALVYDEYRNTALFQDGAGLRTLEDSVTVPHGTEYAFKKGTQNNLKIEWEVWVNRGQSYIPSGAKIVDTPSANQVLLDDTLGVYGTNVDATGSVAINPSDKLTEDVDYLFQKNDDGTFEITFLNALSTAFVIQYESFINASHNDFVTNEVKFEAAGVVSDKTESSDSVQVRLSGGSGSGDGQIGSLIVKKVDEDDPAIELPGAAFSLYFESNGALVRSGVTDENGSIEFANLLRAKYVLVEDKAPDGYVLPVSPQWNIDLTNTADQTVTISNSTTPPPAMLGNYVWYDANRNGIQDEPAANGMNGVKVTLFKENASGDMVEIDNATTADKDGQPGYYLFEGLDAGKYQVCFEQPSGYGFTTPLQGADGALDSDADPAGGCSEAVVLSLGDENLTIDAGLILGRLGDYVWYDANRNGLQDEPAENGMNGVKVTLLKEDASGDMVEIDSATTADKDGRPGYYLFDELPAGKYQVCFEPQSGYGFTTPLQGTDGGLDSDADPTTECSRIVDLSAGEENLTIDAGLILGLLGDYVWFDANRNGIQDEPAENGLNGIQVTLLKEDANGDMVEIDSATTADKDGRPGYYLFDELPAGKYQVCFEPRSGYGFTTPLEGTDGALDSDADPTTECSRIVDLSAGEENLTIDAGLILGRLGDYVWIDANRNGIQDDPIWNGMRGVKVTLLKEDAAGEMIEIDSVMTADRDGIPGYYLFDNLEAGKYQVCFELPSGYAFTTVRQGADIAIDSDADPTVGCSGIIDLSAGEENLTIDAGFIRGSTGAGVIIFPPSVNEPPVIPGDPLNPVEPKEPERPVEPSDPTEPSEPNVPEQPEQPEQPAETPEQPQPAHEERTTQQDTPVAGKVDAPEGAVPVIGTLPKNGTVSIDDQGNWKYTPNPNFHGQDRFTLLMGDGTEHVVDIFIEKPGGDVAGAGDQKEMLPKTGEAAPIAQWVGFLLCAAVLLNRMRGLLKSR